MNNLFLPIACFALLVTVTSCQDQTEPAINSTESTEQESSDIPDNTSPKPQSNGSDSNDFIDESINASDVDKLTTKKGVPPTVTEIVESIPDIEVMRVVTEGPEPPAPEWAYNFHSYTGLNSFLSTYVTYSGHVNYSSIKSNKTELSAIIKEFEENYPASDWSYMQKLTYWINAYNVYTIKLVVDNYPTSSITKITAKPWHKKFIKLGGKTYSLNNIENDIIRAQYNEPRIHFALNCASKSCPVLLNKAYTPTKLYGQLTSQTKRFLKDTSKNDFSGSTLKISKIFDWYGEDFKKNGSTLIDFFNKYRTEQLSSPKIAYMDYSWDLNK